MKILEIAAYTEMKYAWSSDIDTYEDVEQHIYVVEKVISTNMLGGKSVLYIPTTYIDLATPENSSITMVKQSKKVWNAISTFKLDLPASEDTMYGLVVLLNTTSELPVKRRVYNLGFYYI